MLKSLQIYNKKILNHVQMIFDNININTNFVKVLIAYVSITVIKKLLNYSKVYMSNMATVIKYSTGTKHVNLTLKRLYFYKLLSSFDQCQT